MVFVVPTSIYIHNSVWEFPISPHPQQHLLFVVVLLISILIGVMWYISLVLDWFTWWLVMLSIISCACWPSVYLIWKNVPYFNCFFIKLYEFIVLIYLNIYPTSDISFINIFSHSVGNLFVLLIVSFTVQNLFSLM